MSILLFFLLSGFFLVTLLGAVERNRKLLGVAGIWLVVLACIVVFVKPVQLPSLSALRDGTANKVFTTSTTSSTVAPPVTTPVTTTVAPPVAPPQAPPMAPPSGY